jgi:putative flippase GtrA
MAITGSSAARRGREFLASPLGTKLARYFAVSVLATVLTLSLLFIFFRVLPVGSAVLANVLATTISTIPAYFLNRYWAWGKTGKSHLLKEVLPFWVIALVSLVLSSVAVGLVAHAAPSITTSRAVVTVLVELANFCTYLLLWVAKFIIFNRFLFVVDRPG